jgi:prepilin-type N-terminal cleavage/methylation domain-containing protein
MNPRLSHGLTLIEMLVVLLIMGLLVSVTALSTGLAGRSDSEDAARTAEDLSRLFEHAAQQALARGDVLGWSLDADDSRTMQWWRWSSDTGSAVVINTAAAAGGMANSPVATARWQAQSHSFLPTVELPARLVLQLGGQTPGAQASRQAASGPQLVFLPGLETIPFELRVLDVDTGQALARIWSEQPGRVDWGVL